MSYAAKGKPFDPNKPFAWSYSKIKNFETCPKRHFHVDLVGDWREKESEQLRAGNELHDAMARAIGNIGGKQPDGRDAQPLPEHLSAYQPLVDGHRKSRETGAVVATEMKLAINARFEPVAWMAKDAWFRAIADVLVLYGPVALADDWKTGKVVDDSPQLQMGALAIMAHYPQVQRVANRFQWLKESSVSQEIITPADKPRIWAMLQPRVERLRVAYTTPDPGKGFPPQPGPLCRRYCPVKTCPYHGQ